MQTHVYLSIAGENRIAIYTLDSASGGIELQENINVSGSPGPLALSPCGNYLYAGLRSSREIASFRIDEETKHLSLLRTVPVRRGYVLYRNRQNREFPALRLLRRGQGYRSRNRRR